MYNFQYYKSTELTIFIEEELKIKREKSFT